VTDSSIEESEKEIGMGVSLVYNDQTVGNIAMGAVHVFLSITSLVQAELGGIPSGLSPVESDQIQIDRDYLVEFVDEFFRQAEHSGKFRYFGRWAAEMAGLYENITARSPERKISGIDRFCPIRYEM